MALKRGRVISLFYTTTGGRLLLHWVIRNSEGKHELLTPSRHPPYAFVDAQYIRKVKFIARKNKIPVIIEKQENARFMQDKGVPYKVIVTYPKQIGKLAGILNKHKIKLHEADIMYRWRVMIDSGISGYVEIDTRKKTYKPYTPTEEEKTRWRPTVAFWDIETSFTKRKPDPKSDRILSVAVNEKFFCFDDERETIDRAWDYLKTFDYLVSWNGYAFDEPYLRERINQLKLRINLAGVEFIDYMKTFIYLHREVSSQFFSLNEAGERFGGIKKILMEKDFDWYFENDREKLKEYNLRDCEIMQVLDKKTKFTDVFNYISATAGVPAGDMVFISRIPLLMYLRESFSRKERIIVPSTPRFKEGDPESSYVGGKVFATVPGRHKDVFAVDLKGAYVQIIVTCNASPEMWDQEKMTYRQDEDGITRIVIARLGDLREEYKKLRPPDQNDPVYEMYDILQYAVKVMQLTFYGELGRGPTKKSPTGSRIFIRDGAEFITLAVRELIEKAAEVSKRMFGATLVYGDTDSIYITIPSVLGGYTRNMIEGTLKEICYVCNRFYRAMMMDRGVPEYYVTIEMEVQGYYSSYYITEAKKKYIFYQDYDGEKWYDEPIFGYKGMDFKRRETVPLISATQKHVCIMILDDYSIDDIVEYVKDIKRKLYRGLMKSDLIFSYNLTKATDKYKSQTPYVRAAIIAEKKGEREIKTIDYVVVDYLKGDIVVYPIIRGKYPKITKRGLGYYQDRLISTMQNTLSPLIDTNILKARILGKEALVF